MQCMSVPFHKGTKTLYPVRNLYLKFNISYNTCFQRQRQKQFEELLISLTNIFVPSFLFRTTTFMLVLISSIKVVDYSTKSHKLATMLIITL